MNIIWIFSEFLYAWFDIFAILYELPVWFGQLMTHKYRESIVVLSISKSVEPNEEQKEMTSGFQQGNVCKHWNC